MSVLNRLKMLWEILNHRNLESYHRLLQLLEERIPDPTLKDFEARLIHAMYSLSEDYARQQGLKVGSNVSIQPTAVLIGHHNIEIGDNVIIGSYSNIRAVDEKIIIGNNVLIGQLVSIIGANHICKERSILINQQGVESKKIVIQDDVWIGSNTVILPGVTIGTGGVVAGGSVVTKDVATYDIVGGMPAAVIGKRT